MSFFSDIEGVFDPGGDPAAIQKAAQACRDLATSVRQVNTSLDPIASGMEETWKGTASASFQKAWGTFSTGITDYATNLDSAADELDKIAAEIHQAQEEATRLKIMAVAALAVGVGLTIFTFGASDAAAEAEAAADAALAADVMDTLGASIAYTVSYLGSICDALVTVAARFALGAGFSLLSEMIDKGLNGENPFDPANYSADDISNIILGGTLYGVGTTLVGGVEPIGTFFKNSPVLANATFGAAGGFLGSTISQFAIEGKPLDGSTLAAIGESTLLSGAFGAGMGKVFGGKPTDDSPEGESPGSGGTALATDLKLPGMPDAPDMAAPTGPDGAPTANDSSTVEAGTVPVRAGTPEGGLTEPVRGTPDGGTPEGGTAPVRGTPEGGTPEGGTAPVRGTPEGGTPEGGTMPVRGTPEGGTPEGGTAPVRGTPEGGTAPVRAGTPEGGPTEPVQAGTPEGGTAPVRGTPEGGTPEGGTVPVRGTPEGGTPETGTAPVRGTPEGGTPEAGTAPVRGTPEGGTPDGGTVPVRGTPEGGAPGGGTVPVRGTPDAGADAPTSSNRISNILNPVSARTGIKGPDVGRGGIGVGPGILSYYINYGHNGNGIPAVPHAPAPPGPAPVMNVPKPPPPPPHIGGGTFTVQPGDSLYNIAKERLGNPNLYPFIEAANPQVGPGGLITPGQVLHIPQLPVLPPDSVAQIVQPGDSLWEIANGDEALVQRIAELNQLKDPSLIVPGQVLVIPPAA
jgi:WXG100 family type VII secretion target